MFIKIRFSLLLFTLMLSACGPMYRVQSPVVENVPIVDGKPPAATLVINGREQVGEIGTYCWPQEDESALCIDMIGLATPEEAVGANSPLKIRFKIPMNRPPTSLSLQVLGVSAEDEMRDEPINGARFWESQQGFTHPLPNSLSPEITLELEPGLYVFTLFAHWDGVGDAMHGFLVEVQ